MGADLYTNPKYTVAGRADRVDITATTTAGRVVLQVADRASVSRLQHQAIFDSQVCGGPVNRSSRSPMQWSASAGCRNRPAGLTVYWLRRPTRSRLR